MKLSYKKQLKKMEEDSRKVKEMQEQIYGKKEVKKEEELKYRKILAGYYWDGEKEHKLYDKEPI
tara:strand:+ start:147 stop:338 length:192 start_codon:yes stop_codon:yes gene_type:complete